MAQHSTLRERPSNEIFMPSNPWLGLIRSCDRDSSSACYGLRFWLWLEESRGTPVIVLIVGGLCHCLCYYHLVERLDAAFAPGLAERRSKSGHCASLTTFSAIDPKTNGCQPEMPWVEMMTMSICPLSTTSMMHPAISFVTSTLESSH